MVEAVYLMMHEPQLEREVSFGSVSVAIRLRLGLSISDLLRSPFPLNHYRYISRALFHFHRFSEMYVAFQALVEERVARSPIALTHLLLIPVQRTHFPAL